MIAIRSPRSDLVASSLVEFNGARYRMLEPVRQFVDGQLSKAEQSHAPGRMSSGVQPLRPLRPLEAVALVAPVVLDCSRLVGLGLLNSDDGHQSRRSWAPVGGRRSQSR